MTCMAAVDSEVAQDFCAHRHVVATITGCHTRRHFQSVHNWSIAGFENRNESSFLNKRELAIKLKDNFYTSILLHAQHALPIFHHHSIETAGEFSNG